MIADKDAWPDARGQVIARLVRDQHELTWDEYDALMYELKWKDQTIEGLEAKVGLLQSMLSSSRDEAAELRGGDYD